MAQITYENKVKINDSSLPAENKVRDVDMNEIKTVVNENYAEQQQIIADILGTTTPITWESNFSTITGTENSIHVNKAEKSCLLTFAVNRTSATEGSFAIGTFSTTYAPSNLVIGAGIVSTNGIVYACQLSVNSSGSININNTGHSSNTFRGQIKWYYS